MKIACLSDLHGMLPDPVDCDLALISGDICPSGHYLQQLEFLCGKFADWSSQWKKIVFIAGNHDLILYKHRESLPKFPPHVHYLFNSFHEKIYGSPWSLPFGRTMAFMVSEEKIAEHLSHARNAEILLSHAPPYGCGDLTADGENVGSKAVEKFIRIHQPKLVCCGHIHESWGVYEMGKTIVVNAALCNLKKVMTRTPIIIEL